MHVAEVGGDQAGKRFVRFLKSGLGGGQCLEPLCGQAVGGLRFGAGVQKHEIAFLRERFGGLQNGRLVGRVFHCLVVLCLSLLQRGFPLGEKGLGHCDFLARSIDACAVEQRVIDGFSVGNPVSRRGQIDRGKVVVILVGACADRADGVENLLVVFCQSGVSHADGHCGCKAKCKNSFHRMHSSKAVHSGADGSVEGRRMRPAHDVRRGKRSCPSPLPGGFRT